MFLFEFIILGVINALAIVGFHLSVQFEYHFSPKVGDLNLIAKEETRNILWFVKYYGDKWLNEFWRKPFYDCPRCMASVHSTYVYALLGLSWWYYPVYILMLSGIVEIITRKFDI